MQEERTDRYVLWASLGAAGGFAWVVSFDTHNDLRLAVDALSGGRSDTIYAEFCTVVRRNRSRCDTPPSRGQVACARRSTSLIALAIKLRGMFDRGQVRNYADLARLGQVQLRQTRAGAPVSGPSILSGFHGSR
jgi:hypothetical protein